jgi:2-oxoglutarate dehydrogenase E1 component
MYGKIQSHPSVKQLYSNKLISENIISNDEIKKLDDNIYSRLEESLIKGKQIKNIFTPDRPLAYPVSKLEQIKPLEKTSIDNGRLKEIIEGITTIPENFNLNSKLKKSLEKRKQVLAGNGRIDWALAETLAFGSLLLEGFPVRLSGQDSARGTFSQRHLILTDMTTGEEIIPLNNIAPEQSQIEPLDSLLSESAVLGFEYGYSTADPLTLVMWEAQFGDFANGAQVIIDNFIVASRTKWNQPNNLVMLLPHGQEGQGPEHSSARLERFLILCAQENMILVNPTTPAQYFHILRKQVLGRIDIPLVLFTPKSLLRLPAAQSDSRDFTDGGFMEMIDDEVNDREQISNVLITSGKVYYDLIKFRSDNSITNTAIIRIEQYYPLNIDLLKSYLTGYKNVKKISWVQEEPQNMGAWNYIFTSLYDKLPGNMKLNYVGRVESPSPASGSSKEYSKTQAELIRNAFS